MSLFSGFTKAYGTYSSELRAEENGVKLKGRAMSLSRDVTPELWEKHISGEQGLGIIPINEESRVKFAAIDVDQYPIDLVELNEKVQKFKLPLIVCRTKSGGAHLWLFLKGFCDAAVVQKRMREFAAILGYGNSEIFPKQTKIFPERGDIGQWINMPYFRAADTERYAISQDGKKLDVSTFIEYGNQKSLSLEDLEAIDLTAAELLPGGPPCLNYLCSLGFPEGTRNNGLFNLGVYAKRAHPDNWEAVIEEYNVKFMSPPLTISEVLGVMKSIRKKDFGYTCKQAPIANFCNMPKCRACKHGIGNKGAGLPKFGSLSKLITDPPIWFLEIEGGGRLELSTEDLQSQRRFQTRCMSALNIVPSMIKNEEWEEIIRGLFATVTLIEMPADVTPSGILRQHLEEFCTTRAQAKDINEVLLGKPFTDVGFHYFRTRDFLDYLERRKFKLIPLSSIGMYLRDWKAEKIVKNLKGRGTCLTKIPEFKNKQEEKFDPVVETVNVPFT